MVVGGGWWVRGTDPRMWRKREGLYLKIHCHHQNPSCIKMGSDDSHFNVPLIVRDKVTRSQFLKRVEPMRNGTEVLLFTSLMLYCIASPN